VGPRAAVQQLEVVVDELGGGERREHQLSFESQQVERAAALFGIERAECVPAFGPHELRFERGRRVDIATTR
jgi:hypothetical protein